MTVYKRIHIIAVAAITLLFLLNTTSDAALFRLHGMTAQDVFSNAKAAALANAACKGDASEIVHLVHSGADVNYRGKGGISPLIWAMSCHNYNGMRALLKHGANPNQPMEDDQGPVWLAAGGSDPKILPILLKYGGNPNDVHHGRSSALENAIMFQRTANMKLLVQHGANVNYVGLLSAGLNAAGHHRFDYVVFLLKHGYDHDLQELANAILQQKSSFGRYWKETKNGRSKLMYNPHWREDKKQMQQYLYFKQALQMLAAKGYRAHKIAPKILPPPPPLPSGAPIPSGGS
ncbi:ankyrin repeat domain-containing protein [Acidithiobacillus sulfurivorans]|jgi:ankyrin repeat protein|uniref:Ankyrin repeat domain-containing protein n=1 Tax=Acidithiobacillus sulfurivorans TaxID=1958756 RepID=A0ABS5ZXV5_9PROT|nr:hypothetical protein [Acidithiobacillus sulfurivorans]MBU2760030.1 hypothetical protein [Acidithiobacillus sulfurivorans]